MSENLKKGAVPGTMFMCTDNGWINQATFVEWFKFFLANTPSVQPVLIIEDEVIELARTNNVHLLCLPAHCTHTCILQPLDVAVFKSLKSHFSKACRDLSAAIPGRVTLPENLAAIVAEAWPKAENPINIFSGFRKTGVIPLNPGEVTDRYTAPAKVYSLLFLITLTPLSISLVVLVLVKQITVTMIHLLRG